MRQTRFERYDLSGAALQWRDGWLVGQVLTQVQGWLERLECGPAPTPEPRRAGAALRQLAGAAPVVVQPPWKTAPWLRRMEHVLLGAWEAVSAGPVPCPAWGSTDVKRQGQPPRQKKYYAAKPQIQQMPVDRNVCGNPQCQTQTFPDLPRGRLPYAPYRTETPLLALQM